MPVDSDLLVLAIDDHIWLDSESLISYLRSVERMTQNHLDAARRDCDESGALAAYSSQDMVRQIADGLVLTTMTASEKLRSRRESRR
jgi:hypothetical protein